MSFAIWFFTLLGALFVASAVYSLATWWQVRGLTGLMHGFLFLALAWIAFSTVWAVSPQARVGMALIVASQRSAWSVAGLSGFILADQYAARWNSHRALTTKAYMAFMRWSEERRDAT